MRKPPGGWPFAIATLVLVAVVVGALQTNTFGLGDYESPDSSPTTQPDISKGDYSPGDCVTWDEPFPDDTDLSANRVDCDSPHKIEIVAERDFDASRSAPYPDEAAWASFTDTTCQAAVDEYLGRSLDSAGRLGPALLRPDQPTWIAGQRTVDCGIAQKQLSTETTDGSLVEFSGRAKGQDLEPLYPPGSCVLYGEEYLSTPCVNEHDGEVVGSARVDLETRPADDATWDGILSDACERQALAYTGGVLPDGFRATWNYIEAKSWDAGRREADCLIAKYDSANTRIDVTGSVRTI